MNERMVKSMTSEFVMLLDSGPASKTLKISSFTMVQAMESVSRISAKLSRRRCLLPLSVRTGSV